MYTTYKSLMYYVKLKGIDNKIPLTTNQVLSIQKSDFVSLKKINESLHIDKIIKIDKKKKKNKEIIDQYFD